MGFAGLDPTYTHLGPVIGVKHRALGPSVYLLFDSMADLAVWCEVNDCALGIIFPADPDNPWE